MKKVNKEIVRELSIYKGIIRPVRNNIGKMPYIFNTQFYSMKNDREHKRIILLLSPEHSNLGDQMIALAELKFLDDSIKGDNKKHIYEFTYINWKMWKRKIVKEIRKDDLILIHGGGFIGSFYSELENEILDILKIFKNNQIIVLPQTIYFEDIQKSKKEIAELKVRINNCFDVTLLVRDKKSYDFAVDKLNVKYEKCFLVPDIVTYCNYSKISNREKKILLIMRNDCEKICDNSKLDFLYQMKELEGYEILSTDMHYKKSVLMRKRKKVVYEKLAEFSKASLVITDRLHGMVFSAITGTPCIAFDNKSEKVSGQYEWIKYLPYIRQKTIEQVSSIDVIEMINMNKREKEYTNKPLRKYYIQIANLIEGKL